MGRRRFVGLVAAGVSTALAAGVSGCGVVGSSGSKGVTLHLVAADYGDAGTPSSSVYWNRMARGFEADHPHITVDVDVVDWDHVDDKVDSMVKKGEAPDLAQIGSYADYATKGLLYRADDLFKISQQADFITSLANAGSVDHVQYGLPWVSSSRLFFYNRTLFREAGISAAPRTWDELAQDAAKLKDHGVKVPYGLPLGAEEAQAETLMWMLENAGGYTDTGGGYAINSPANISTFDWIKDKLVAKGLTGPTAPGATNRRTVFADFLAGKVGMLNGHPTLLSQAEAAHIDVGVAALPGRLEPAPDTLGVADWMMAFKNTGDHLTAQSEFLQYVYSTKNSLAFLEEYGLLPVTTSALQEMEKDPKLADMRQFLDKLPSATFYPVDKTSWGAVSDEVKKSMGKAVQGDPGTVLGQIQRFADEQDGK